MKFYTVKEMAISWGVSVQLVRKYLSDGRIPGAFLQGKSWLIPENAEKPGLPPREQPDMSQFLKKVLYQQIRNNHFGIYEYIQLNMAYSSNRMASNRLTREQIEMIYRRDRIDPGFEPVKIDDVLEIVNHIDAMNFVISSAMHPLTIEYIKKLHYMLTNGTFSDGRQHFDCGTFRTKSVIKKYRETAVAPKQILKTMTSLVLAYEKENADLRKILDFHVRFERIRPFADYNGRVGRLIMLKECLRYGIDPFIVDDKHRALYYRGIIMWDDDPSVLTEAVLQAQKRFRSQMDTCRLFEYHRTQNPRKLL